jgi:hypothetical protein
MVHVCRSSEVWRCIILNLVTLAPQAVNPNFFSKPNKHFVVPVAPDRLRASPVVSISAAVVTGANHISERCQETSNHSIQLEQPKGIAAGGSVMRVEAYKGDIPLCPTKNEVRGIIMPLQC